MTTDDTSPRDLPSRRAVGAADSPKDSSSLQRVDVVSNVLRLGRNHIASLLLEHAVGFDASPRYCRRDRRFTRGLFESGGQTTCRPATVSCLRQRPRSSCSDCAMASTNSDRDASDRTVRTVLSYLRQWMGPGSRSGVQPSMLG